MKSMPMRGERTATNKAKKANPFGKPETKKPYAAMGKKMEPGMPKGMKK